MGRVKEQLLTMEYKQMEKLPNENLKEYLLTIECEYKLQANEQDNYYLLKYCLLDLRSLETITISEQILNISIQMLNAGIQAFNTGKNMNMMMNIQNSYDKLKKISVQINSIISEYDNMNQMQLMQQQMMMQQMQQQMMMQQQIEAQ